MELSQLATDNKAFVNFTLAPINFLNNTGTISYDPDGLGGDVPGFLYIGGSGTTVTNTGLIETKGLNGFIYMDLYTRYKMKGIEFRSPINGNGTVKSVDGGLIGITTVGSTGQLYDLKESILYVTYFETAQTLNYIDNGWARVVWLDGGRIHTEDVNYDGGLINANISGQLSSFRNKCKYHSYSSKGGFFIVEGEEVDVRDVGWKEVGIVALTNGYEKCDYNIDEDLPTETLTIIVETLTAPITTTEDCVAYEGNIPVTEKVVVYRIPPPETIFTTTTVSTIRIPRTVISQTTITESDGFTTEAFVYLVQTPPTTSTVTGTTVYSTELNIEITSPVTSTQTSTMTSSSFLALLEVKVDVQIPPMTTWSVTFTDDLFDKTMFFTQAATKTGPDGLSTPGGVGYCRRTHTNSWSPLDHDNIPHLDESFY